MIKNNYILLTLLTLLNASSPISARALGNTTQQTVTMQPTIQPPATPQQKNRTHKKVSHKKRISLNGPRLSQFPYRSASVAAYYVDNQGIKHFFIAPEAGGNDRGTYCDFGGGREKGENHPVTTAAHEFWEEAILQHTVGFSLDHTRNFIDLDKSNNTQMIIAYSNNKIRHVCYIVDFTQYAKKLCTNFAAARQQVKERRFREKTTIALVSEAALKDAITPKQPTFIGRLFSNWFNSKKRRPVTVIARVQDPQTGMFTTQEVTLRPIFVKSLRPYFLNKPYQQGLSKKIRFYTE